MVNDIVQREHWVQIKRQKERQRDSDREDIGDGLEKRAFPESIFQCLFCS